MLPAPLTRSPRARAVSMLLLRVSCSVLGAACCLLAAAGAAQGQRWTAERVLTVGENQGIEFGQVRDIAAGDDGRFFVLDRMESRVHTFSADGKLESSFGKRGAGPGEISDLAVALMVSGDELVVVDTRNRRLSVFEKDGTFVTSRPIDIMQGLPMRWQAAGRRVAWLVRPMPTAPGRSNPFSGVTKYTILAADPRSDAAPDTLVRLELPSDSEMEVAGSTIRMKANLGAARALLGGDGAGRLLVARSDTFRIRMMDTSKGLESWITHPVERHRYTRGELEEMREEADVEVSRAFRSGAEAGARMGGGRSAPEPEIEFIMPEYAPALVSILAGDRTLLTQSAYTPRDAKQVTWDVLTYDGRSLGTLTLPAGFTPHAHRGDRIYGVEKDEYDVDSVVVYRITQRK